MKFPHLFQQIHGDSIFGIWAKCNQPTIVHIIPQEPLGRVKMNPPDGRVPDGTVTVVSVRCWNDQGVMKCEAAHPADLKVAQDWAQRHKDTPPEDFKWLPEFKS